MRALRLLHELLLGDKKLLVKVDAKTKAQLDEWKAKKRGANKVRSSPAESHHEILFLFCIDCHSNIYVLFSSLTYRKPVGQTMRRRKKRSWMRKPCVRTRV